MCWKQNKHSVRVQYTTIEILRIYCEQKKNFQKKRLLTDGVGINYQLSAHTKAK